MSSEAQSLQRAAAVTDPAGRACEHHQLDGLSGARDAELLPASRSRTYMMSSTSIGPQVEFIL